MERPKHPADARGGIGRVGTAFQFDQVGFDLFEALLSFDQEFPNGFV
jgi:hypothetical protein